MIEVTEVAAVRMRVVACAKLVLRVAAPFGLGALLGHAGCSPSSAKGGDDDLIAPPSVALLTADPDSITLAVHRLSPAQFPPGSDYFRDAAHQYVFDAAADELDVVNDVLCELAQARCGEFVNRGLYLAQIDAALCDPAGTGLTALGTTRTLEPWIVRSVRRDRVGPQHVDFWVPDRFDAPTQGTKTLFSALDVYAPATAANPFGIFTLHFAGTPPFGDPAVADYSGYLKTRVPRTGRIGYDLFFQRGDPNALPAVGDEHRLLQVAVDLAADQSTGLARVSRVERFNDPINGDSGLLAATFRLAFDATTAVRQQDALPPVASSRTSFRVANRRYRLYFDDPFLGPLGDRVALRSGVPLLLPNGAHAVLDSGGLHVLGDFGYADGDVVTEDGPAPGAPAWTLRVAPGRLIECTRQTTRLVNIVNEVFEWIEPFNPAAPPARRLRVSFDGVDFFAFEEFVEATASWQPIVPFTIPLDTYLVLRMSSPRYGGNCVARFGANDLAWFTERVVSGDEALFGGATSVAFHALLDGLRPQLTGAEVDVGDVHLPPAPSTTQPWTYRFDRADRTLKYIDPNLNVSPVTLAPLEFVSSGPYLAGMRSGPLVLDATTLPKVDAIWDEPLFWVWETGQNPWNQWVGLIDAAGNAVPIDSPLQFDYTHATANDANGDPTFDGQQFLLEYRGDGQLVGIPWAPIDTDQDGVVDHDAPLFSLADGVVVGPKGAGYVVKTMERELLLLPVVPVPPGLDPAQADVLLLPDGSNYRTPAIGPVPPLDESPAVVGGEILAVPRR